MVLVCCEDLRSNVGHEEDKQFRWLGIGVGDEGDELKSRMELVG